MKNRRWLNLMLLGLLVLLPCICYGQTYQGPSGGRGGKPFDHWNESGGATDIGHVAVFVDNSVIRCIYVTYRDSFGKPSHRIKSGFCPQDDFRPIRGWTGIALDPGEYIIGIAGRHGDLIDSIRFYTSKKNSPVFGGSGGSADFGYTAPPGQRIVGFFGRAGDSVDAIGVLFAAQR
jgi:hypothetical protein